MSHIHVSHLHKTYEVPEREAGLRAAFASIFHRRTRKVHAVADVSFEVQPGEIVGFLGPNGAGKTTTLKILSGLLYPTGGEVSVLGHCPWERQHAFLRRITLVMGQRNQLVWDLPAIDSFERNRAIYDLGRKDYQRTLDELTELLDLKELLGKPARNLSLGERMKCEVAVGLLHRPEVIFLDEPTIGLDVTMQRRIRAFLAEHNQRYQTTLLLTSHYMADVEALCKRVIIIHQGTVLFDGQLSDLVARYSMEKTIVVKLQNGAASSEEIRALGGTAMEDGTIRFRAPKEQTAALTARVLTDLSVFDLTVEDAPIEEVIERVFARPGATEGPA